ncbi:bifunctional diguanylate cyclase/phosphodiesterase [Salinarimonas chemoclinalis]|uniref:bifunctional diguanylate cyclase/phosphodiesterase n=1 Tax=Salinarimonas chemoclinalis TaxID=3241599 RepID=UPI003558CE90
MVRSWVRRGRPTFSAYLIALSLALSVPLLAFAAVVSYELGTKERAEVEAGVFDAAARVRRAADALVADALSGLRILATSRAVRSNDLSGFHAEALVVGRELGGHVALADAAGERLAYTRVPWGTLLSSIDEGGVVAAVVRTGEPFVSGLLTSPQTGERFVAVAVPVHAGADTGRVLTLEIPLRKLLETVVSADVGTPRWGSISDRDGTVLARSADNADHVGRRLPGFSELTSPAGTWRGTGFLGITVFGAYERSDLTGWTAGVGVDEAALDAPVAAWRMRLVGLAALVLAITAIVAVPICREIAGTFAQLTAMARRLGMGQPLAAPDVRIAEARTIASVMARASVHLSRRNAFLREAKDDLEARVAARTRELEEKTTLLQTTLDHMDQGLVMVDADGRVSVYNRRAVDLLELPEDLVASRPTVAELHAHQLARNEFVRDEDAERVKELYGGSAFKERLYERERPNGTILEIRTVPRPEGGAVRTFTDVTARKTAEAELARMARHDSLTGLPNRASLRERLKERLAEALRHDRPFSVLCLDLDRFKVVNDTMGHAAGDMLLGLVAERLREVVRGEDFLARVGGDEFVLLCPEASGCARDETSGAALAQRIIAALAQRIIAALAQPFALSGKPIEIGVSIGIANAPRDGGTIDDLLKAADLALYRAKGDGRNTHRVFAPEMDAANIERQVLEIELRHAIQRGEITLAYQPIVDVHGGGVTAVEALCRWTHPRLGAISPARFIPLAEETGLIAPLGAFVLETACREAAGWGTPVRIAVNVSAVQFARADLLAVVVAALEASRLPVDRLELEITESVLMDGATVLDTLHALRRLGVRLAMDDFGTGYSSLGYLERFPFDKLKIDGSFVKRIASTEADAIVRAIASLGERLGMTITAEGVETSEQLRLVREVGCQEAQGYHVGRPVPAEEIRHRLRGGRTEAA